jgi:hypothetical protein
LETLAHLGGLLSGLAFVAPNLEPRVMLATSFAVQLTHAIVCRIFAAQGGRKSTRWAVAGLLCGVATVAVLLYLTAADPRHEQEEPQRAA